MNCSSLYFENVQNAIKEAGAMVAAKEEAAISRCFKRSRSMLQSLLDERSTSLAEAGVGRGESLTQDRCDARKSVQHAVKVAWVACRTQRKLIKTLRD